MADIAQKQHYLRLGDEVPDFKAETQLGDIHFHEFIKDSWAILFSHPRDFTPVCTTELGRVAKLHDEWAKRKVKVVALSVDGCEDHKAWIHDIEETQKVKVDYPIIADKNREIAFLYGMLDQTHLNEKGLPLTVRSLFVIGPDKKIKSIISYPAPTGRNFNEILRVIDSLQLAVSHKVATPADWEKGQDVIILPTVNDDDAAKLFPKGFQKVRPYLRVTPDPSKE